MSLARSQFDILLSIFTTAGIIFVDRITKWFFSDFLAYGESFPLIKNILHMTLVQNTGIAFGLFKDQGIVFIILPIVAIAILVYNIIYYRHDQDALSRPYIIAYSLILAGAIGNLYDRIFLGYVVDFIDFRIWPVFNVADSAITIGAGMVIWDITFKCFKKEN